LWRSGGEVGKIDGGRPGSSSAMDVRAPPRATFEFGPYRLDAARGVLTRQGEPIALTPRLLETLLYLVENPGRVVSKDEMLHALWPGRIADETNLSQAIFTLRKALADGAEGDRLIVTAPGRGYRFTPEVRVAPAWVDLPPRLTTPSPAPPVSTGRQRRPWIAGLACLGVLSGAAGIGAWALHLGASHLPSDRTGVVLADFQNFTGEAVFSHVLGKALEVDLAQSPFLRVTPQSQVAATLELMARRRDEPLTDTVARDVCVRDNGGAVIAGAIAALGTRYLLTLTASDCVTGRILDEEKELADSKEGIAPALDRLASRTRQKLGESQASIARFGVPLLPERTASFEALRSYSDGVWLVDHGQSADAVPLFRHAIALDGNFAAAYEALTIVLVNARQYEAAAETSTRAYELRDYVSERRKLQIVDIYTHDVSKDLDAELDNLRLWARLYPSDPTPWTSLANLESFVGQHLAAVEAAKRALALRGDAESSYAILIRAETRAGLFDQAQAVGERAVAKGLAGSEHPQSADDARLCAPRHGRRGEGARLGQRPVRRADDAVLGRQDRPRRWTPEAGYRAQRTGCRSGTIAEADLPGSGRAGADAGRVRPEGSGVGAFERRFA
jgi:DNA-binding winged helix-turn-helix (wHTH) protein/tetratricopeptide (TPR) repeat protein